MARPQGDWRSALSQFVDSTDDNLRAMRKDPVPPPTAPVGARAQQRQHPEAVASARAELSSLLAAVQGSLADLRVEVAAAKRLSNNASAAVADMSPAPKAIHGRASSAQGRIRERPSADVTPPVHMRTAAATPQFSMGHGQPAFGPLFATPAGPDAIVISPRALPAMVTPPSGGASALSSAARGPNANEDLVKTIDHRLLELGQKIERSLERSLEEQSLRSQLQQVQQAIQAAATVQQQQQQQQQLLIRSSAASPGYGNAVAASVTGLQELGPLAPAPPPPHAKGHTGNGAGGASGSSSPSPLVILAMNKADAAEKISGEVRSELAALEKQATKAAEDTERRLAGLQDAERQHWEKLCQVSSHVDALLAQRAAAAELQAEVARVSGRLLQLESGQDRTMSSLDEQQRLLRQLGVAVQKTGQEADSERAVASSRLAELSTKLEAAGTRTGELEVRMARFADVDHKLSRLSDLEARVSRLGDVEGRLGRLPEIEGRVLRLADLEVRVARLGDVEGRLGRLGELEARVGRLGDVEARLGRLSEMEGRLARLGDVEAKLARLPEMEAKLARVGEVEARLSRLGDVEGRLARLGELEMQVARVGDAGAKQGRLAEAEGPRDLEGQVGRLADLEARVATLQAAVMTPQPAVTKRGAPPPLQPGVDAGDMQEALRRLGALEQQVAQLAAGDQASQVQERDRRRGQTQIVSTSSNELARPDGTPVWLADSVASPASSMRTSGPGQNPKRPSGQHVSFADRPVTTRDLDERIRVIEENFLQGSMSSSPAVGGTSKALASLSSRLDRLEQIVRADSSIESMAQEARLAVTEEFVLELRRDFHDVVGPTLEKLAAHVSELRKGQGQGGSPEAGKMASELRNLNQRVEVLATEVSTLAVQGLAGSSARALAVPPEGLRSRGPSATGNDDPAVAAAAAQERLLVLEAQVKELGAAMEDTSSIFARLQRHQGHIEVLQHELDALKGSVEQQLAEVREQLEAADGGAGEAAAAAAEDARGGVEALRDQVAEVSETLGGLQQQLEEGLTGVQGSVDRVWDRVEQQAAGLARAEEELGKQGPAVQELVGRVEDTANRVSAAEAQLEEEAQRVHELSERLDEQEAAVKAAQAATAALAAAGAAREEEELGEQAATVRELADRVEDTANRVSAAEAQLEEEVQRVQELTERLEEQEAAVKAAQVTAAAATAAAAARAARAEAELEEQGTAVQELAGRVEDTANRVSAAEAQLEEEAQRVNELSERLEKQEASVKAAQAAAAAAAAAGGVAAGVSAAAASAASAAGGGAGMLSRSLPPANAGSNAAAAAAEAARPGEAALDALGDELRGKLAELKGSIGDARKELGGKVQVLDAQVQELLAFREEMLSNCVDLQDGLDRAANAAEEATRKAEERDVKLQALSEQVQAQGQAQAAALVTHAGASPISPSATTPVRPVRAGSNSRIPLPGDGAAASSSSIGGAAAATDSLQAELQVLQQKVSSSTSEQLERLEAMDAKVHALSELLTAASRDSQVASEARSRAEELSYELSQVQEALDSLATDSGRLAEKLAEVECASTAAAQQAKQAVEQAAAQSEAVEEVREGLQRLETRVASLALPLTPLHGAPAALMSPVTLRVPGRSPLSRGDVEDDVPEHVRLGGAGSTAQGMELQSTRAGVPAAQAIFNPLFSEESGELADAAMASQYVRSAGGASEADAGGLAMRAAPPKALQPLAPLSPPMARGAPAQLPQLPEDSSVRDKAMFYEHLAATTSGQMSEGSGAQALQALGPGPRRGPAPLSPRNTSAATEDADIDDSPSSPGGAAAVAANAVGVRSLRQAVAAVDGGAARPQAAAAEEPAPVPTKVRGAGALAAVRAARSGMSLSGELPSPRSMGLAAGGLQQSRGLDSLDEEGDSPGGSGAAQQVFGREQTFRRGQADEEVSVSGDEQEHEEEEVEGGREGRRVGREQTFWRGAGDEEVSVGSDEGTDEEEELEVEVDASQVDQLLQEEDDEGAVGVYGAQAERLGLGADTESEDGDEGVRVTKPRASRLGASDGVFDDEDGDEEQQAVRALGAEASGHAGSGFDDEDEDAHEGGVRPAGLLPPQSQAPPPAQEPPLSPAQQPPKRTSFPGSQAPSRRNIPLPPPSPGTSRKSLAGAPSPGTSRKSLAGAPSPGTSRKSLAGAVAAVRAARVSKAGDSADIDEDIELEPGINPSGFDHDDDDEFLPAALAPSSAATASAPPPHHASTSTSQAAPAPTPSPAPPVEEPSSALSTSGLAPLAPLGGLSSAAAALLTASTDSLSRRRLPPLGALPPLGGTSGALSTSRNLDLQPPGPLRSPLVSGNISGHLSGDLQAFAPSPLGAGAPQPAAAATPTAPAPATTPAALTAPLSSIPPPLRGSLGGTASSGGALTAQSTEDPLQPAAPSLLATSGDIPSRRLLSPLAPLQRPSLSGNLPSLGGAPPATSSPSMNPAASSPHSTTSAANSPAGTAPATESPQGAQPTTRRVSSSSLLPTAPAAASSSPQGGKAPAPGSALPALKLTPAMAPPASAAAAVSSEDITSERSGFSGMSLGDLHGMGPSRTSLHGGGRGEAVAESAADPVAAELYAPPAVLIPGAAAAAAVAGGGGDGASAVAAAMAEEEDGDAADGQDFGRAAAVSGVRGEVEREDEGEVERWLPGAAAGGGRVGGVSDSAAAEDEDDKAAAGGLGYGFAAELSGAHREIVGEGEDDGGAEAREEGRGFEWREVGVPAEEEAEEAGAGDQQLQLQFGLEEDWDDEEGEHASEPEPDSEASALAQEASRPLEAPSEPLQQEPSPAAPLHVPAAGPSRGRLVQLEALSRRTLATEGTASQVYDEDYEVDDDEYGEQDGMRWEMVAQQERVEAQWAGEEQEGSEAGAAADDALSSRGISREASTVNPNPAPMRMSGSGTGPVQTLSTPSKKGLASLLESSGDSDGDEVDSRRRSGASSAAAAAARAAAVASGLSRSHMSTFGFSEEDEVDLPDGADLPGLEGEQQQQRAAGGDSLFSDGSASLEAAGSGAVNSPERAFGAQGQKPSSADARSRGPRELVLPQEADAAEAGEALGTAGSTASTGAGASTGRSEPTVSPGGTARTTHDRSHFRRRPVASSAVEPSSPPAGVTADSEDDDLELDGLAPPPQHAQRSSVSEPADQEDDEEGDAAAEVQETSTAGPAAAASLPTAAAPTAATARGMFSYDLSMADDDSGLPLARRGSLSSSLGDRLPYGTGRGTAAYGGAYDGSMELEDGRYADLADRSAELPSGPMGLGLDADESFGSLGAPPELPGSRLGDSGPLSRSSGASSAGPGRRSSTGVGERDGASRGAGAAGLSNREGPAVGGGVSRRALEASGSMAASRSIMPEESYGLIAPPEGAGLGLLGSGSDGDEDMFADSADGAALGGMSLEQSRKSVGLPEGRAGVQQRQTQDGGEQESGDEDGDQGLAEQPSGVSVVSSAGAASGPFGKLRNQPSGLLSLRSSGRALPTGEPSAESIGFNGDVSVEAERIAAMLSQRPSMSGAFDGAARAPPPAPSSGAATHRRRSSSGASASARSQPGSGAPLANRQLSTTIDEGRVQGSLDYWDEEEEATTSGEESDSGSTAGAGAGRGLTVDVDADDDGDGDDGEVPAALAKSNLFAAYGTPKGAGTSGGASAAGGSAAGRGGPQAGGAGLYSDDSSMELEVFRPLSTATAPTAGAAKGAPAERKAPAAGGGLGAGASRNRKMVAEASAGSDPLGIGLSHDSFLDEDDLPGELPYSRDYGDSGDEVALPGLEARGAGPAKVGSGLYRRVEDEDEDRQSLASSSGLAAAAEEKEEDVETEEEEDAQSRTPLPPPPPPPPPAAAAAPSRPALPALPFANSIGDLSTSSGAYRLQVVTGDRAMSGCTAGAVRVTLYGSESTHAALLRPRGGAGSELFGPGCADDFMVDAAGDLGDLAALHIWHEGEGYSSSWFVDSVTVEQLMTGLEWTFPVHDWVRGGARGGKVVRLPGAGLSLSQENSLDRWDAAAAAAAGATGRGAPGSSDDGGIPQPAGPASTAAPGRGGLPPVGPSAARALRLEPLGFGAGSGGSAGSGLGAGGPQRRGMAAFGDESLDLSSDMNSPSQSMELGPVGAGGSAGERGASPPRAGAVSRKGALGAAAALAMRAGISERVLGEGSVFSVTESVDASGVFEEEEEEEEQEEAPGRVQRGEPARSGAAAVAAGGGGGGGGRPKGAAGLPSGLGIVLDEDIEDSDHMLSTSANLGLGPVSSSVRSAPRAAALPSLVSPRPPLPPTAPRRRDASDEPGDGGSGAGGSNSRGPSPTSSFATAAIIAGRVQQALPPTPPANRRSSSGTTGASAAGTSAGGRRLSGGSLEPENSYDSFGSVTSGGGRRRVRISAAEDDDASSAAGGPAPLTTELSVEGSELSASSVASLAPLAPGGVRPPALGGGAVGVRWLGTSTKRVSWAEYAEEYEFESGGGGGSSGSVASMTEEELLEWQGEATRPDLSRVSYDNLMSAAGPVGASAAAASAGATTGDKEQRQPGGAVSGSPPGGHGHGSSGGGGGGFTEVRLRRRLSEHQGAYAYKIKVLTADRLNAGLGSTTVHLELLGRTATVCQALPRGKGSFGRGCCDRFTLYSHEGDMGPILAIKIWHEGKTLGPGSWGMEQVVVDDRLKATRYVFSNPAAGCVLRKGRQHCLVLKPAVQRIDEAEDLAEVVREYETQLAANRGLTASDRAGLRGKLDRIQQHLGRLGRGRGGSGAAGVSGR